MGTIQNYLHALVIVHTEEGKAREVAQRLSQDWHYAPGEEYLVMGVRWAAAMASRSVVILSARFANEFELQEYRRIVEALGKTNPSPEIVDQYYKDGRVCSPPHDGLP